LVLCHDLGSRHLRHTISDITDGSGKIFRGGVDSFELLLCIYTDANAPGYFEHKSFAQCF